MKKQFIISDQKWPMSIYRDLLLTINERDAGQIQIDQLGPRLFTLRLMVFGDAWNTLPIITADLYQHTAGAAPVGYATLQSATQAAAAILAAHGWEDTTEDMKIKAELAPAAGEAGQGLAEFILLCLFILAAIIVLGALIGIDVSHIINNVLRWFFPWGGF
jgi:hypothetical protein